MNPQMIARQKSLQSLMDAMDEDAVRKLPGFTIEISPTGSESSEKEEITSDEQPLDDPFEELLRKKKMEQKINGY